MKINFDYSTNQTVDRSTTAKSATDRNIDNTHGSRIDSGYVLDITGTGMDNRAYAGHGRTAEDVMQDAKRQDVVWQKNYMAVMSNSISEEDFQRLQEGDFSPGSMDAETVVTIVDKIKAEMALGGVQVEGYTDDIDEEVLKAIVGDSGLARDIRDSYREYQVPLTEENAAETKEAAEKASGIPRLSEGACKYLVINEMEPTVEHLYMAQYSAAAEGGGQGRGYYQEETDGYYARKADEIDWGQLEQQIEKVIEDAGLGDAGTQDGQSALPEAKWLIQNGIPLTADTLKLYHKINRITFPLEQKEVTDAAARAVADGSRPGSADVTREYTLLERAVEIYEGFQNSDGSAGEDITARRQLEEVRLRMTVQANLYLLKSGYSIDTAPLEELVEKLKEAETQLNTRLFGGEDAQEAAEKAGLYTQTLRRTAEIPALPAAVVGKFADSLDRATVSTVYEDGSRLQQTYAKAEESYEALMTAPRKDMGDSIRKAFRNIDDILRELDMDTSEQNRRAVRILGYNSTPVTQENIERVKTADQTVQNVLEQMTPSAVLKMIRAGKNPLTMSLPEMEDYFSGQNKDPQEETEKYSKFLYKLEKNSEITQEEKESFIGIYRLMRQVEKSDGAVIGSLLEQGAQINFKNMLSAVRSGRKAPTDVRIDDSFGTVDEARTPVNSISEQIGKGYSGTQNEYYRQLADEALRNLTPESLAQTKVDGAVTLEQFADAIKYSEKDKKTEESYQKEQIREIRNIRFGDDSAIQELLDFKQPVTADNVLAANMLLGKRGALFGRIYDKAEQYGKGREELKKAAKHLAENFDSARSAADGYDKVTAVSNDILEEAAMQPENAYLDVREMVLLHKQLSLAAGLSREESYEVPVELNGRMSSIRLTVIHNGEDAGKVDAVFETPELGKAAARFQLKENRLTGYILCDSERSADFMRDKQEQLQENLQSRGFDVKDIQVLKREGLDLNSFGETGKGDKTSSSRLYQVAKSFLEAFY